MKRSSTLEDSSLVLISPAMARSFLLEQTMGLSTASMRDSLETSTPYLHKSTVVNRLSSVASG